MADKSQVIVADATLAVQAQLVDVLSGAVNVTSVINAEQLWHRLEQGHGDTDLLILDAALVAPGLDVFCRKWLAAPETRAADIIVMGPDNSDYEVMALTAGAVDYLRKPLNLPVCLARGKNALRQRERRQQLESMSLTDSLTGLANRRYLDDFLQSEWRQAQRTQGALGLLMVDIDHFKAYNDHYGHPQGDRCLAQVAHCLKSAVQRPRDLVARYGGEEFAGILPAVHKEGVAVVAERIREAVHNMAIPHAASLVEEYVTLSFGLAWCEPLQGEEPGLLVEAADEALYSAKAAWRDCMSETVDLASIRHLLPH